MTYWDVPHKERFSLVQLGPISGVENVPLPAGDFPEADFWGSISGT
jgi:hypothetical protein